MQLFTIEIEHEWGKESPFTWQRTKTTSEVGSELLPTPHTNFESSDEQRVVSKEERGAQIFSSIVILKYVSIREPRYFLYLFLLILPKYPQNLKCRKTFRRFQNQLKLKIFFSTEFFLIFLETFF